ncbi:MAG: hypothetical protein QM680_13425 [Luteolibacter sp.]
MIRATWRSLDAGASGVSSAAGFYFFYFQPISSATGILNHASFNLARFIL